MTRLHQIYHHIKNHGAYIVDERALGAWREAKRAYEAEKLGFGVTWEIEPGDWMEFAGDPANEYKRNFESGKWECFHAYVQDDAGNILASLGGIILSADSDSYRQCVEFELLAEALTEILKGNVA